MLLNSLVNIILPQYCFSCRKIGNPVCRSCAKKLSYRKSIFSRKQGLHSLISFYKYSGVFKKTLRGAKYFSVRSALDILCQDIPFEKHVLYEKDWSIIPVPLHKKRLNERGFNQAEVIAEYVSRKTGLKIRPCVKRIRYTEKQARLAKYERQHNLKGAFMIEDSVPDKVLIVDDVWTTGSTIYEIAYVLKKHGASRISALTLAR